jgi:hypothetical protein
MALVLVYGGRAAAQTQPEDRRAAEEVTHAMMHGEHDVMAQRHLLMSSPRSASAADSARAAELVSTIRRALGKYRDVAAARADGYEEFLPNVPQPVYHFTNWLSGFSEVFGFDPARPTSLLYRRDAEGRYTLTGVMYTAPRWLEESALDARIPLGIARWHQHVDWCLPPRNQQARWSEVKDGHPVFGPESPIATREACFEAGGRFVPHLFGWMVHVNAFESDDPQAIWSDHH